MYSSKRVFIVQTNDTQFSDEMCHFRWEYTVKNQIKSMRFKTFVIKSIFISMNMRTAARFSQSYQSHGCSRCFISLFPLFHMKLPCSLSSNDSQCDLNAMSPRCVHTKRTKCCQTLINRINIISEMQTMLCYNGTVSWFILAGDQWQRPCYIHCNNSDFIRSKQKKENPLFL